MTLDLDGTPVEGRVLSTYRDAWYDEGSVPGIVSRVEVETVGVALVVDGRIVGWEATCRVCGFNAQPCLGWEGDLCPACQEPAQ